MRTPGGLEGSKSRKDINIDCRKDGVFETISVIESQAVATGAGNILVGGVIGLAMDAASGANFVYPTQIHVTLAPTSFATVDERDAFFDAAETAIEEAYAAEIAEVTEKCGRIEDADCFALKNVETRRSAAVNQRSSHRTLATAYAPESTLEPPVDEPVAE